MRRFAFLVLVVVASSAGVVHGQEQILELDDVGLRYEVAGEGPAVVLVHGWAMSLETWDFLFPELAHDHRVVRYDRRGFGESGGAVDLSLDPVDLRDLLDALGIERAVVVGHSQGAMSALRFALAFPERLGGLVLYGSGPVEGFGLPWTGPDAIQFDLLARTAREQGLEAMRALFADHPIMNGFVEGTEGYAITMESFEAYDGQDILDPKPPANATPAPSIDRLGEIDVPTLVITGDMEMPYLQIHSDALAYGIPGAERVVVEGGGHAVHVQVPERFNGEIERFLRSLR